MKKWYFAECKSCLEICYIFVSNPSCTATFLSDEDEQIQKWLEKHDGCELTLGWRDDHLDNLWERGYKNSDFEKHTGINI